MTNTQYILSKLRLRLIPNVTKFRVASVEYLDKPLLFGILKKSRRFETAELRSIKKRNKYLMRSYKRLIAYASTFQVQKFENLAMTLIRSSSSYQLAMLCSASKDWYCRKPCWILKLWKQISNLRDETGIHYERWWIDKKPGDYARPLGAPKAHWKVNMLKYLMVLEIYYHTTDMYPDWQHAGTSKRGLVSAWRDVLVKALPSKYIFEFDIKGFFDQIQNQDSVVELPRINARLNKMVNSQPTKFNLPPVDKDPVDLDDILDVSGASDLFSVTQIIDDERAHGREAWKGLGRSNRGFPQGANFSPFLSCLVLARAVAHLPGLIMYMDDGLIYAQTRGQLGQRIRRLKERLATIGLKLAEEKSGMVKDPLEFKGIKFLGIRVYPERDMWSETRSGTIKPAAVRLLTKKEYENLGHFLEIDDPSRSYEAHIKDLARATSTKENQLIRLFAEGLRVSTASEQRVRDWVVNKSLDPLNALRWAAQNSFFSSIVAEIHDPRLTLEEQQQLEGEIRKLDLCWKPETLSNYVMRLKMARDPLYIPDITTISSASALELFKRLRRMRRRGKLGSRGGARKITRR
jgi:hypothetical protein